MPEPWPKDIFKSFKIIPTKHLSKAFKNLSKIAKGTWNAMGKAAKEIKTVTNLFAAFGSESLITKVFNKVIGNYTKYLSDTFWGEVVKEIDFDVMTTAITDILGPIFSGIGEWIGDRIAEAPVAASIGGAVGGLLGGALGSLIGSAYGPMGQVVGTLAGMAIGWLADQLAGEVKPLPGEPGGIPRDYTSEEYYNWYHANKPFRGTAGAYIPKPTWTPPPPSTRDYSQLIGSNISLIDALYSGLQEFQLGTSYVPRTGPAIVHRGEEIIPANRRGSRGEITINIDLRNAVVDNVDRLSQKIAEQVMIRIG